MKKTVYIQTNSMSHVPALVSKYSYEKFNPDWDVKILYMDKDFKNFDKFDGNIFYRNIPEKLISKDILNGEKKREVLGECTWYKDNSIQNFFPMRFLIPEFVDYSGICLLVESDIFCLKKLDIEKYLDPTKKLSAVMQTDGPGKDFPASSVLLFDASKLKEWNLEYISNYMFESKKDFNNLMYLRDMHNNNEINIMPLKYNDFNNIDDNTILTHMINTITQPWKTGLEYRVDMLHNSTKSEDKNVIIKKFEKHTNPNIEKVFIDLAKEALVNGTLTLDDINCDINKGYIRKDFKELIRIKLKEDADIEILNYGQVPENLLVNIPYEKKWTSSDGQDRIVAEIFKNKKSFFVELGGDDGLRKSNTFGLESILGWKGAIVESRPIFNKSCEMKRKCKCICETIFSEEKILEFDIHTEAGGTSGITHLFNKFSHRKNGTYYTLTKTLEQIFKENNIPKNIGYLSIDIEGAEYDALKNFPFEEYNILLISFEDHAESNFHLNLKPLLENNNYKFLCKTRLDTFYIKNL